MPLWHITFISFKEYTSEDAREKIFQDLQEMAENCGGNKAGILYWQVGKNLDLRKGVHLLVISVFDSQEALEKYKGHAAHERMTSALRLAAD